MTTQCNSDPPRETRQREIAQVDLGELKARAIAASEAEGVRLSEWIRRAVQKALPTAEASQTLRPTRLSRNASSRAAGKIELDDALVQRMGALVERGRFRTRTAALRALLDGVPMAEPNSLADAVRALGESNFHLVAVGRDFAQCARAIRAEPMTSTVAQRLAVERATRAVHEHLEIAARVVGRLRPQLKATGEGA